MKPWVFSASSPLSPLSRGLFCWRQALASRWHSAFIYITECESFNRRERKRGRQCGKLKSAEKAGCKITNDILTKHKTVCVHSCMRLWSWQYFSVTEANGTAMSAVEVTRWLMGGGIQLFFHSLQTLLSSRVAWRPPSRVHHCHIIVLLFLFYL